MKLILQRVGEKHNATLGRLYVPGTNRIIYTLEDAWRDNKRNESCIPVGEYEFAPHGWGQPANAHFKRVWRLKNVPGREGILIHSGNTIEDTSGCILIGFDSSVALGHAVIFHSRPAIDLLREIVGIQSGTLDIRPNQ